MKKLVAILCLGSFALSHTPENLNIVWARPANANAMLYKEADENSPAVKIDENDIPHISEQKEVDGKLWYRAYILKPVLKGMKSADEAVASGWMRAEDTWFSDVHDIGFYPLSHTLFDRLRMKLERYVGNYPQRSRLIFGREKRAKFFKGRGTAIQALSWDGLEIVYENSYKQPHYAWINYIQVFGGNDKVSFGPIKIGSPKEAVLALKDELGFEYKYMDRNVKLYNEFSHDKLSDNFELITITSTDYEGKPYLNHAFRFFIEDDKVITMEFCYGFSGRPSQYLGELE